MDEMEKLADTEAEVEETAEAAEVVQDDLPPEAPKPVFSAQARGPVVKPVSRRDQINSALRALVFGKI